MCEVSEFEQKAASNFLMISGKEANIRKVVGIVLYVSAALCFFLLGSDFASPAVWSSVTAAGIMIHRMGIQSQ